MLIDPKFYNNIKLQLSKGNQVLSAARLGGILSSDYVNSIQDPNQANETQRLIKHDKEFRTYLKTRPTSAETTASKFYRKSKVILNNDKVDMF